MLRTLLGYIEGLYGVKGLTLGLGPVNVNFDARLVVDFTKKDPLDALVQLRIRGPRSG
jgi:hypothetical protein